MLDNVCCFSHLGDVLWVLHLLVNFFLGLSGEVVGGASSLASELIDELLDFLLMLLKVGLEKLGVNQLGAINGWVHQGDEEHKSDKVVVWNESQDESNEHFNCLEDAVNAPE